MSSERAWAEGARAARSDASGIAKAVSGEDGRASDGTQSDIQGEGVARGSRVRASAVWQRAAL